MLHRSKGDDMPNDATGPAGVLSLLTGLAQQGTQTLFATQRTVLDVAVGQASRTMKSLQAGLAESGSLSTAIAANLIVEAAANFIDAQRVLLDLAQQQNEILMNGLKERLNGAVPAVAMTEIARRSLNAFLDMQHEFLTLASEQAKIWYEAAQAGNLNGVCLADFAREAMATFARSQEKFMSVVAEEAGKAASGKHEGKKAAGKEVQEIARAIRLIH
jgi:hypothetical protein